MTKIEIPKREMIYPGHSFCPGCGAPIALRHALAVLGENTIRMGTANCDVVCTSFEANALKIPNTHSLFESTAARASGLKAGLRVKGFPETTVLAWSGDGGLDIGFQALSHAAAINIDILFACYDNEGYMNTGVQQSDLTPKGARTTVSLAGKTVNKKDLAMIMAGHNIPYFATATIAFLDDLRMKFLKAKEIKGTRVIHILSPCPTGWQMDESLSVEVSRQAVASRIFPLLEIFDGRKFIINEMPPKIPIKDYFVIQGRFKHLSEEETETSQRYTDARMGYFEKLASLN